TATTTTRVTVSEPPIAATAVPVAGFEFTPAADVPVATFTHGNGSDSPGDFRVTGDWGDGVSSAGVVIQAGGTYTVLGSHTYTEDGSYTIRVNISEDSASTTVHTTATMLEELLPDGTRGTLDQRWLSEIYRDLLGRKIDVLGLSNATNALNNGIS